jgi:hypothetical protein
MCLAWIGMRAAEKLVHFRDMRITIPHQLGFGQTDLM